jgi:hypothetical protein
LNLTYLLIFALIMFAITTAFSLVDPKGKFFGSKAEKITTVVMAIMGIGLFFYLGGIDVGDYIVAFIVLCVAFLIPTLFSKARHKLSILWQK